MIAFLIAIVLAVLLGQLQNKARSEGTIDPVSSLVQKVTVPLVQTVNNGANGLATSWTNWTNAPQIAEETKRLRQIEQSYKTYNQTIESLRSELSQLRELTQMPNFGRERVPVRIVGYFPYENRLTLLAGSKSGVKVGMPVVTAQGLIGIVQTVGNDKCQALTVTSPTVRYGAMVLREPPVPGIMKGQTPTRLVLDVLDAGKIEVGDPVVTSGYSDKIPRGIPVGTVAEVFPDPSYGTRRVFVAPSVTFGQSLEAWVLK